MASATCAFIPHWAPDCQKGKRLLDRELSVALGLNLGHDGGADAIELQANDRRFGSRPAPALNQRLDPNLIVVREMGETNPELTNVRAAFVGPNDPTSGKTDARIESPPAPTLMPSASNS
jgi:hypothetical protein